MKTFTEVQARMIMEQLLLALDFFQMKRIIHRDIKLDNILVNEIDSDHYEIKIADFGLSAFTLENQLIFERCGIPGYVAPEILQKKCYGYKSDMFGAGVIFYNILTGK